MFRKLEYFKILYRYFHSYGYWGVKFLFAQKKGVIKNFKEYSFPIYFRPRSSDISIFSHILLHEEYNINQIKSPSTIIDGGANIGLSTVYFANKYPQAKIMAIEPDEENFNLLKKNTAAYKNVNQINSGLWGSDCFLKIKSRTQHHCGIEVEETFNSDPNGFPAVSLNSMITEYKLASIDILKLDIEGSEKELFEVNYEKWLPITKMIMVEIHDRKKKGCSTAVFRAILQYDFSLSISGEYLVFVNNKFTR